MVSVPVEIDDPSSINLYTGRSFGPILSSNRRRHFAIRPRRTFRHCVMYVLLRDGLLRFVFEEHDEALAISNNRRVYNVEARIEEEFCRSEALKILRRRQVDAMIQTVVAALIRLREATRNCRRPKQ